MTNKEDVAVPTAAVTPSGMNHLVANVYDMEETHRHWFIALEKITGAKPIPATAAGNIPRKVDAWLQWARDHGYEW